MKRAIFFLTLVLLINFIAGMYYDFYEYWWFDVILHFLGGFFVAMLMVHYLKITELRITNYELTAIKGYLIIVGAVSFIGVVWEFAEYLASLTLIESFYNNFGVKTSFI